MDQIACSMRSRRRKNAKRAMFTAIVLTFVTIAVFSAQTYAYFTDTGAGSMNQIYAGGLDIELVRIQEAGEEQVSYTAPVKFMPATEIAKTVKVKNTGSLPVYIRIRVKKAISNTENEVPDSWENLISCDFRADDPSTPEIAEGSWIYSDGYYYYSSPLAPEDISESLFEKVCFSKDIGNEFANSKILFSLVCQATQANGNSDSPLTATGWPSSGNE